MPADAQQRLAGALRSLYEEAGSPTLRALARRASESLSAASASPTSISDWMNAKAVPARKVDLAAVVTALTSATSRTAGREVVRFEELRRAAARESRSQKPNSQDDRQWLGKSVDSYTNPIHLEVHRPIRMTGAPSGVPAYIERAHDAELRTTLNSNGPQFVVLVGGSSTGKTRAAYEAAQQLKGWHLFHPISPSKPTALTQALTSDSLHPRTIIWLNELQDYLLTEGGERAAAELKDFLDSNVTQVKVLATMWPRYWQDLTNPTYPSPHVRTLLNSMAVRIEVTPTFPVQALNKAAKADIRIRAALKANPSRITQYIAAGPALLDFFRDCRDVNPGTYAILSATMDAFTIGRPDAVTESFLRRSAPAYLTDEEWGACSEHWFDEAIEFASRELRGAARPLAKVRSRTATCSRYRLADYLIQHAQAERSQMPVPRLFWDAVLENADDPVAASMFARAADERGMFEAAARLWSPLASDGDPEALGALLANPTVDKESARTALRDFIDTIDLSDASAVAWLLSELLKRPEERIRLVRRMASSQESLTVGPSAFDAGLIFEELESGGEARAAENYAHLIQSSVSLIDMSDFWSTVSLIEMLWDSRIEAAEKASKEIALAYFRQADMPPEHLAAFLARIDATSELAGWVRKKLHEVADSVDVTNVLTIRPYIGNLFAANESDLAVHILSRVRQQIGDLNLGNSYAPLELLDKLRNLGYAESVIELGDRISRDFDPGLSHASVVALRHLKKNGCTEAFIAMAVRLAETGPILPLSGAEEFEAFLSNEGLEKLSTLYAQRVHAFKTAEGGGGPA
ncbi:hypothetical protein ACF1G0_24520 [Streptomyces sp. NPDC013953]|uniref:hypothetical protein n=1 Tax=Streptomyces sp. NPDC013953 TaxID=3364868 RepID=UPI0036F5CF84